MTEITFYRDNNNKITGFEASGHAGFARYQKDIVCASISALTITFINSLESILHIVPEVVSEERKGYMKVTVKDYDSEQVQLLFESLSLGLNGIQESYPKNLKLTNRR